MRAAKRTITYGLGVMAAVAVLAAFWPAVAAAVHGLFVTTVTVGLLVPGGVLVSRAVRLVQVRRADRAAAIEPAVTSGTLQPAAVTATLQKSA